MAGDEFALVVASETDWAWDVDAVVAAVPSRWPRTKVYDGYPVPGSTCRAILDIADPKGDLQLQMAVDESGKMISFQYGDPQPTAELVTWLLQQFPPPDDVTVQLFEWGSHPRVTRQTTVQDLLAIGP